jgi:hypothetical protein
MTVKVFGQKEYKGESKEQVHAIGSLQATEQLAKSLDVVILMILTMRDAAVVRRQEQGRSGIAAHCV